MKRAAYDRNRKTKYTTKSINFFHFRIRRSKVYAIQHITFKFLTQYIYIYMYPLITY